VSFDYASSPVAVRDDILEAHERAWERLSRPGTWWTAAERLEIAAEVRNAVDCELCRERKASESHFSIDGEHRHSATLLAAVAVDAVHRIVTDASRLSRSWLEKNESNGLSDGHYVELLGIVVSVFSVDELHRGLGLPHAPLPDPQPGEPTRQRPSGLRSGVAWVPILPASAVGKGPHADLYHGLPKAPNVIAAMSLVPDAVHQLDELSAAHYLPITRITDPSSGGKALSRQQIELVAARVAAINECFY
jgi:hypothetical protein